MPSNSACARISDPACTPAPVARRRQGLDGLLAHAAELKAVFTDLDGTFLDARHQMPARAEQVVERLQATGVRFVPTSGRTLHALNAFFGPLAGRIDAVACNGMDVVAGGAHIHHALCPRTDAQALLDAVVECDLALGFAVFGMGDPYLLDIEADFTRSCIESLEHARTAPLAGGLADEPISKVAVIARDDAAAACRLLAARMGARFDFAPCGQHWIDVLVKGTDKIDGIRMVMDRLGAAPSEVAAFGDSMNDLGMMCGLPLSVAVANAMPALKERCAFEIGSNADGAVLDCLERIAVIRER